MYAYETEPKKRTQKSKQDTEHSRTSPMSADFTPLQMQEAHTKHLSHNTVHTMEPKQEAPPGYFINRANNTGIPGAMKARFENMSGFSFDDVRVHYNSDKPPRLGALAYTQGSQVYIAQGQEKHLSHELGHVIQQKRGIVKPSFHLDGIPVNDDYRLEREASKMAYIPHSVEFNDNLPYIGNTLQMVTDPELKALAGAFSRTYHRPFNLRDMVTFLRMLHKTLQFDEPIGFEEFAEALSADEAEQKIDFLIQEYLGLLEEEGETGGETEEDVSEEEEDEEEEEAPLGNILTIGDQEYQTADEADLFGYRPYPTRLVKGEVPQERLDLLARRGIQMDERPIMLTDDGRLAVAGEEKITVERPSPGGKTARKTETRFVPTGIYPLPFQVGHRDILAFDHPYTKGRRPDAKEDVHGLMDSFFRYGATQNFARIRVMVRARDSYDRSTLLPYKLEHWDKGLYPYRIQRTQQEHHAKTNERSKLPPINPSRESVLIKYANFSALFPELYALAGHISEGENMPDFIMPFTNQVTADIDNYRFPQSLRMRLIPLIHNYVVTTLAMTSEDLSVPENMARCMELLKQIAAAVFSFRPAAVDYATMYPNRPAKEMMDSADPGEDEFSDPDDEDNPMAEQSVRPRPRPMPRPKPKPMKSSRRFKY